MKKIGEYTARGKIGETATEAGTPQRIALFDGKFDTAYRVVDFVVWGASVGSSTGGDGVGKLCTSDQCTVGIDDFFNANDSREIAWGYVEVGTDSGGGGIDNIIDPDNLVVEDLFVYARNANDGKELNYLVTMEKYEVTDWQGALAMARDKQND